MFYTSRIGSCLQARRPRWRRCHPFPTATTHLTIIRCLALAALISQPLIPQIRAQVPMQVSARLRLKSKHAKMEDDARQWLACVSGTTACRPLSGTALRGAFQYFDTDHSGLIQPVPAFPCCSSELARTYSPHLTVTILFRGSDWSSSGYAWPCLGVSGRA